MLLMVFGYKIVNKLLKTFLKIIFSISCKSDFLEKWLQKPIFFKDNTKFCNPSIVLYNYKKLRRVCQRLPDEVKKQKIKYDENNKAINIRLRQRPGVRGTAHADHEWCQPPFWLYAAEKVRERLDWELEVIQSRGVADRFLMMQDLTNALRRMGLSAGAGFEAATCSMVAYCLFVTDINPLKCNLLFETFLNPDGTSLPEMELNLAEGDKPKVVKWLTKRYGKEQENNPTVGLVELRACSIIKEAVRNMLEFTKICLDVNSVPLNDVETISSFRYGDMLGISQFEEPTLQALLREIMPIAFEELMAVYALNHMGLSDRTKQYIQNRQLWNRRGGAKVCH